MHVSHEPDGLAGINEKHDEPAPTGRSGAPDSSLAAEGEICRGVANILTLSLYQG